MRARHAQVLEEMVTDWIEEGFTTPPYSDSHYDVFEWLGLDPERFSYDIRRPEREEET